MARAKQIVEGEWNHLPRLWRQLCCHCGLTHDWDLKIINGKIYGRIHINGRATANARRAKGLKAKVKK